MNALWDIYLTDDTVKVYTLISRERVIKRRKVRAERGYRKGWWMNFYHKNNSWEVEGEEEEFVYWICGFGEDLRQGE